MNITKLDAKLTELNRLRDLKKDLESAITIFSKQVDKPSYNPNSIYLTHGTISGCGSIVLNPNKLPISDDVHNLIKVDVVNLLEELEIN